MPYGNQSGLVGEGMDPRLLQQDFSGYADAARIQSAGIMSAADTVKTQVDDYTKEQKKAKEALKSGAMMIDAASKMFPSQAPAFNGISQQLKDENIPLNERAAMASQVGGLINMTVGEGRYQQEMGMKERELDWRMQGDDQETRMNELRITEAEMELARRQQEDSIMDEVGAARFERALKLSDSIPEKDRPFTAEYLKKAKTLDPRAQFKLAELIEQALPAPVKKELKNIPATINGQPGELPVLIDPYGNIDPVQLDGGVLPPKPGSEVPTMLQTVEGPELPANEAVKVGQIQAQDGTPLDAMSWNGAVYHVPSQAAPAAQPGVTMGRQMVSPKETPNEMLTKKRMSEMDSTLTTVRDQGMDMAQQIGTLERATNLLDEMQTGFSKELQMKAKRVFGADVANQEEFQSLAGKFVMDNIALTKGAVSDSEMEYFKKELSPGMGKSTEGNKRIIAFKLAYAKRAQQISNFIAEAQASGTDPFTIRKTVDSFINSNPLSIAVAGETKTSKESGANGYFNRFK